MNFLSNISFFAEEPSDIIIFDETNSNLVKGIIPEGLSISIFKTRPVQFYLTFSIVINFFLNLKYLRFRNGYRRSKGYFFSILWELQCIWIKSILLSRKPKAIITNIDNCSKFAWLSENYHEAPCIAIQNGFRLSYDEDRSSPYYCQHLLCFGDREIIDFPKLGYKVDNFYPVGSLNASINFQKDLDIKEAEYDLLLVSCWRGNIGYGKDVQDSMRAMRSMDQQLSIYLKEVNTKAAVILRSERDSDQWFVPEIGMSEEDYYLSIYGDSIEIIDKDFIERNIYPLMQSADVIIAGFSTTCLIEAYSIGKKVLYMNFCETDDYHKDFVQEIVFKGNENTFQEFKSRVNELRDITKDEYFKDNESLMKYYMRNSLQHSVRDNIRKRVSQIVLSGT